MNHRRIARTYLGWFEQEAYNFSLPASSTATPPIIWNEAGTYVIGYVGANGTRSYQGFIADLCSARLESKKDEDKVMTAAVELVTAV